MALREGQAAPDDALARATLLADLGGSTSLVRELVRTDSEIERLTGHAESWTRRERLVDYRKRLARWHYASVRGAVDQALVVCPHCERITQARAEHWVHFRSFKRGRVHCQYCARVYDASGALDG